MDLFVHDRTGEDPQILEVDATAVVRTLVAEDGSDAAVWVEEFDEEVDLDINFEQAGIGHRHHVHRGHCRHVEVMVRFNRTFERAFGPAATIKRVYAWASGPNGANLSPEQAARHVLAIPGADHFLDSGVHIGSLVTPGTCSVTLDLLPRERFEG